MILKALQTSESLDTRYSTCFTKTNTLMVALCNMLEPFQKHEKLYNYKHMSPSFL